MAMLSLYTRSSVHFWPLLYETIHNSAEWPIALLREWRRRNRERAELAAFDDRMLRDIGVTRCDVMNEISKPFWRK